MANTGIQGYGQGPIGEPAGDLEGSLPGPVYVKSIQGSPVSSTPPSNGDALVWNSTDGQYEPQAVGGGGAPTGSAGGDLGGSYPDPSVTHIQGKAVSATAPSNGQALVWNSTDNQYEPGSVANGNPTGNAGGDLGSTYPNPTVVAIRGKSVSASAPTNGQVLAWSTGSNAYVPSSGAAPGGSAGGDLSGTYPNPQVAQIQGIPVSGTTPTTNQTLVYNGTSYVPSSPPQATIIGSNVQSGSSYTTVLGDAGLEINMTNASANSVTIPPHSSVAYPNGTVMAIRQFGTGQTTIAAGAGVTLLTASSLTTRAQYSAVSVRQSSQDVWTLDGDLT